VSEAKKFAQQFVNDSLREVEVSENMRDALTSALALAWQAGYVRGFANATKKETKEEPND